MVVNDFNVFGVSVNEAEAYTVLLIDTNGVLAFAFARKGFESIPRR